MRKLTGLLLSVIAVVVLHSPLAHADKLGIIGGYRSNNLSYDQSFISFSSMSGYQAGLLYQWSFAEIFAIRTGAVYANRDVSFTIPPSTANFTLHASYIDIPIDLQVNFPIGLYLYAGVKEGLKNSSSCDAPAGGTCSGMDVTSNDLVANVGLGYEIISFGVGGLTLEGEYESGLSNVAGGTATGTAKTNGWAANLVAWFGF